MSTQNVRSGQYFINFKLTQRGIQIINANISSTTDISHNHDVVKQFADRAQNWNMINIFSPERYLRHLDVLCQQIGVSFNLKRSESNHNNNDNNNNNNNNNNQQQSNPIRNTNLKATVSHAIQPHFEGLMSHRTNNSSAQQQQQQPRQQGRFYGHQKPSTVQPPPLPNSLNTHHKTNHHNNGKNSNNNNNNNNNGQNVQNDTPQSSQASSKLGSDTPPFKNTHPSALQTPSNSQPNANPQNNQQPPLNLSSLAQHISTPAHPAQRTTQGRGLVNLSTLQGPLFNNMQNQQNVSHIEQKNRNHTQQQQHSSSASPQLLSTSNKPTNPSTSTTTQQSSQQQKQHHQQQQHSSPNLKPSIHHYAPNQQHSTLQLTARIYYDARQRAHLSYKLGAQTREKFILEQQYYNDLYHPPGSHNVHNPVKIPALTFIPTPFQPTFIQQQHRLFIVSSLRINNHDALIQAYNFFHFADTPSSQYEHWSDCVESVINQFPLAQDSPDYLPLIYAQLDEISPFDLSSLRTPNLQYQITSDQWGYIHFFNWVRHFTSTPDEFDLFYNIIFPTIQRCVLELPFNLAMDCNWGHDPFSLPILSTELVKSLTHVFDDDDIPVDIVGLSQIDSFHRNNVKTFGMNAVEALTELEEIKEYEQLNNENWGNYYITNNNNPTNVPVPQQCSLDELVAISKDSIKSDNEDDMNKMCDDTTTTSATTDNKSSIKKNNNSKSNKKKYTDNIYQLPSTIENAQFTSFSLEQLDQIDWSEHKTLEKELGIFLGPENDTNLLKTPITSTSHQSDNTHTDKNTSQTTPNTKQNNSVLKEDNNNNNNLKKNNNCNPSDAQYIDTMMNQLLEQPNPTALQQEPGLFFGPSMAKLVLSRRTIAGFIGMGLFGNCYGNMMSQWDNYALPKLFSSLKQPNSTGAAKFTAMLMYFAYFHPSNNLSTPFPDAPVSNYPWLAQNQSNGQQQQNNVKKPNTHIPFDSTTPLIPHWPPYSSYNNIHGTVEMVINGPMINVDWFIDVVLGRVRVRNDLFKREWLLQKSAWDVILENKQVMDVLTPNNMRAPDPRHLSDKYKKSKIQAIVNKAKNKIGNGTTLSNQSSRLDNCDGVNDPGETSNEITVILIDDSDKEDQEIQQQITQDEEYFDPFHKPLSSNFDKHTYSAQPILPIAPGLDITLPLAGTIRHLYCPMPRLYSLAEYISNVNISNALRYDTYTHSPSKSFQRYRKNTEVDAYFKAAKSIYQNDGGDPEDLETKALYTGPAERANSLRSVANTLPNSSESPYNRWAYGVDAIKLYFVMMNGSYQRLNLSIIGKTGKNDPTTYTNTAVLYHAALINKFKQLATLWGLHTNRLFDHNRVDNLLTFDNLTSNGHNDDQIDQIKVHSPMVNFLPNLIQHEYMLKQLAFIITVLHPRNPNIINDDFDFLQYDSTYSPTNTNTINPQAWKGGNALPNGNNNNNNNNRDKNQQRSNQQQQQLQQQQRQGGDIRKLFQNQRNMPHGGGGNNSRDQFNIFDHQSQSPPRNQQNMRPNNNFSPNRLHQQQQRQQQQQVRPNQPPPRRLNTLDDDIGDDNQNRNDQLSYSEMCDLKALQDQINAEEDEAEANQLRDALAQEQEDIVDLFNGDDFDIPQPMNFQHQQSSLNNMRQSQHQQQSGRSMYQSNNFQAQQNAQQLSRDRFTRPINPNSINDPNALFTDPFADDSFTDDPLSAPPTLPNIIMMMGEDNIGDISSDQDEISSTSAPTNISNNTNQTTTTTTTTTTTRTTHASLQKLDALNIISPYSVTYPTPCDTPALKDAINSVIAPASYRFESLPLRFVNSTGLCDFANKSVGGGTMSTGAVQEEIMFANSAECLVSQFIMDTLHDHWAGRIIGVVKHSICSGYASTLKFSQRLSCIDHDFTQQQWKNINNIQNEMLQSSSLPTDKNNHTNSTSSPIDTNSPHHRYHQQHDDVVNKIIQKRYFSDEDLTWPLLTTPIATNKFDQPPVHITTGIFTHQAREYNTKNAKLYNPTHIEKKTHPQASNAPYHSNYLSPINTYPTYTIVVIDALQYSQDGSDAQFSPDKIKREIVKLMSGLSNLNTAYSYNSHMLRVYTLNQIYFQKTTPVQRDHDLNNVFLHSQNVDCEYIYFNNFILDYFRPMHLRYQHLYNSKHPYSPISTITNNVDNNNNNNNNTHKNSPCIIASLQYTTSPRRFDPTDVDSESNITPSPLQHLKNHHDTVMRSQSMIKMHQYNRLQRELSKQRNLTTFCGGNWGCGVFHGDHRLKLFIQLITTSLSDTYFRYYPVGDVRTNGFHQFAMQIYQNATRQIDMSCLVSSFAHTFTDDGNTDDDITGLDESPISVFLPNVTINLCNDIENKEFAYQVDQFFATYPYRIEDRKFPSTPLISHLATMQRMVADSLLGAQRVVLQPYLAWYNIQSYYTNLCNLIPNPAFFINSLIGEGLKQYHYDLQQKNLVSINSAQSNPIQLPLYHPLATLLRSHGEYYLSQVILQFDKSNSHCITASSDVTTKIVKAEDQIERLEALQLDKQQSIEQFTQKYQVPMLDDNLIAAFEPIFDQFNRQATKHEKLAELKGEQREKFKQVNQLIENQKSTQEQFQQQFDHLRTQLAQYKQKNGLAGFVNDDDGEDENEEEEDQEQQDEDQNTDEDDSDVDHDEAVESNVNPVKKRGIDQLEDVTTYVLDDSGDDVSPAQPTDFDQEYSQTGPLPPPNPLPYSLESDDDDDDGSGGDGGYDGGNPYHQHTHVNNRTTSYPQQQQYAHYNSQQQQYRRPIPQHSQYNHDIQRHIQVYETNYSKLLQIRQNISKHTAAILDLTRTKQKIVDAFEETKQTSLAVENDIKTILFRNYNTLDDIVSHINDVYIPYTFDYEQREEISGQLFGKLFIKWQKEKGKRGVDQDADYIHQPLSELPLRELNGDDIIEITTPRQEVDKKTGNLVQIASDFDDDVIYPQHMPGYEHMFEYINSISCCIEQYHRDQELFLDRKDFLQEKQSETNQKLTNLLTRCENLRQQAQKLDMIPQQIKTIKNYTSRLFKNWSNQLNHHQTIKIVSTFPAYLSTFNLTTVPSLVPTISPAYSNQWGVCVLADFGTKNNQAETIMDFAQRRLFMSCPVYWKDLITDEFNQNVANGVVLGLVPWCFDFYQSSSTAGVDDIAKRIDLMIKHLQPKISFLDSLDNLRNKTSLPQ